MYAAYSGQEDLLWPELWQYEQWTVTEGIMILPSYGPSEQNPLFLFIFS